jgi:Secretion system C-terminal sorting domain
LYAQFNGVTSFSGGTGASGVGGGASPLPISLLYFTGAVKGKNVELEWQTSSELNNDFFTLERSADGKTFEPIAQIRGAGTTTQTQKYTFTDVQPLPNTSYYRLTQTDFDGKTAQHNTVNVQFKTTKLFEISPNPIRDVLFVSFSNINPTETATLEVLNMLGQLVYTEQIPENTVQRKIDASAFAAGAYAIRLRQAEKAYTTIFIK